MRIMLLVRVLDEERSTIGAYYRNVKLPFIPSIGMKLKLSSSISLWETQDGKELDPPIKEIVYNLDDDEIYCLFEIDEFLISKYWTRITNIENSHELKQFNLHVDSGKVQAEQAVSENVKNATENRSKYSTLRMLFYIMVIPISTFFIDEVVSVIT